MLFHSNKRKQRAAATAEKEGAPPKQAAWTPPALVLDMPEPEKAPAAEKAGFFAATIARLCALWIGWGKHAISRIPSPAEHVWIQLPSVSGNFSNKIFHGLASGHLWTLCCPSSIKPSL